MARAMKDSGVEWIGVIPEGWEIIKGKFLFRARSSKGNDTLQLLSASQTHGMCPQEMLEGVVKVKDDADLQTFKTVHQGDFVISLRSFQGGFEYSLYEGVCSPAYQVFYPITETRDGYYRLLFKTGPFIETLNSITLGIREGKNILFADFSQFWLPLPPAQEQQRIADFLDTQTAEIDASIAKTQESIEEYKKLKQAVITQAVTKGIRPGRVMKDSGVEWIGEIPEEWEMDKAIRLWKARKGSNAAVLTSEYCGQHRGPYPVYSGQTENNGIMGMIDSYAFDVGDDGCLFSTTVGAKAMSVAHLTNKFSLSQNCMIMQRENSNICVRYFYFFFTHEFAYNRSLIPDYMQPSFRVKDFNAFPVLLPSYEEQQEIAAYLDEKCAAIDTLIEKKQTIITELEAYKKSLIYEYVTGKKEVPVASC